jgi:uncharacterized protein
MCRTENVAFPPCTSVSSVVIALGFHPASEVPSYNAEVMIAKELLEMLVCPACKQSLEYRQNPESLKCAQCHRVYLVKDDIPIMLIDEAKIEP